MLITVAFWAFAACALGMLLLAGDADARHLASACLIAILATFGINAATGFIAAQPIVLGIDAALLGYAVLLSMRSASYWPLWFSGFQAIAVASGLAGMAFPGEIIRLYINYGGFWALPALGAAVAGVMLDRRAAAGRKFSLGSHL